jgi:hypothetical protein
MNTLHKQRGMSIWGMSVVAAMAVVLFIQAIKLFPVYMEFFNMKGIIEQVKNDPDMENAPKDKILSSLHKRVGLADLENIKTTDYSLTKIPGRNAYTVDLYYEVVTPVFANLSMLATFEYSDEVGE